MKPRRAAYKKSEESQDKVLDAAISALAERGVTATSMQDIASVAGLSKGVIHYHFSSKEELLVRVLDRCCELMETRVRATFDEPGAPIDRIRRAIVEMWRLRRDNAPEWRVVSELHVLARTNPAIAVAFGNANRRAREQVVAIGYAKLVELGLRPKISLTVAPRLLLAALDGLALQHDVDPVTPAEEAELLQVIEATALAMFEL